VGVMLCLERFTDFFGLRDCGDSREVAKY